MKQKRVSEMAEAAVDKRSDLREAEMQWLEENRETVANLGGQWIAVEGNRLVSHSADFADVLETTKKEGIQIPFILFVPENFTDPIAGL